MKPKTFHLFVLLALALSLGISLLMAAESAPKAEKPKKLAYSASIYQQTRPGMPIMQVQIYINEFSTAEEAAQLAQILKDSGQAGLTKALSKMKEKGNIAIGRRTGYRIGFIRQLPTPDGGCIIRMATDRPITIPELWGGARSQDYTIGIAELKLDAAGKGEGALIYAAAVEFNAQGMLEVKTYGIAPAKLVNVRQN